MQVIKGGAGGYPRSSRDMASSAAMQPARHLPDLAGSLNNLSNCLSDAKDTAGALAAIREAVATWRRLAEAQPTRYQQDLAGSLNNMATCLSDAGDKHGALEAIREATAIYRSLAEVRPARYEPDLARSLAILAWILLGI